MCRSPSPVTARCRGTADRSHEGAGALRDIVQNHALQLLALVAMEALELSFSADAIRDEKVKVLRSVVPLS